MREGEVVVVILVLVLVLGVCLLGTVSVSGSMSVSVSGTEWAEASSLFDESFHAHTNHLNLSGFNPTLCKMRRPSGHHFLNIVHHVFGF